MISGFDLLLHASIRMVHRTSPRPPTRLVGRQLGETCHPSTTWPGVVKHDSQHKLAIEQTFTSHRASLAHPQRYHHDPNSTPLTPTVAGRILRQQLGPASVDITSIKQLLGRLFLRPAALQSQCRLHLKTCGMIRSPESHPRSSLRLLSRHYRLHLTNVLTWSKAAHSNCTRKGAFVATWS